MNFKALVEHGFEKRVQKLRAGLATQMPASHVFAQTGGSIPLTAAIAQLDAYLALGKAADDAEQAAQTARQKLLAATPAAYSFSESMRSLVKGFFGAAHPVLSYFGIQPKRRRKLKMVEEAAAAVRRGETRKIGGTLGPKEKLKLKSPKVELSFTAAKPETEPEGDE